MSEEHPPDLDGADQTMTEDTSTDLRTVTGFASKAIAFTAIALLSCATAMSGPSIEAEAVRPAAALGGGEAPAADPESKKDSARPPVTPVPAESRSPEEAAQRAADPKAPTGALIIRPPSSVMPPDTPPPAPKQ